MSVRKVEAKLSKALGLFDRVKASLRAVVEMAAREQQALDDERDFHKQRIEEIRDEYTATFDARRRAEKSITELNRITGDE
jgi:hypothetical protein